MQRSAHGLGRLQNHVMDLVWEMGEATVAQVVERMSRRRRVTYTTVLVAMQKLEKKGWLAHRSAGRAYVYRPTRSRQAAATSLIRELLNTSFRGDPRLLLSHLLDEHSLSDADLAELRSLIEARRKEKRHE